MNEKFKVKLLPEMNQDVIYRLEQQLNLCEVFTQSLIRSNDILNEKYRRLQVTTALVAGLCTGVGVVIGALLC